MKIHSNNTIQLENLKTKLESIEDKLDEEFDFDTLISIITVGVSGIIWIDGRSVNLGYLYINKDLVLPWDSAKQYCEATQNGHLIGRQRFLKKLLQRLYFLFLL